MKSKNKVKNKWFQSKKSWKNILIILGVLVAIGLLIVLPICWMWRSAPISYSKQYGIPELVYYSSQVVGVLAMMGTVIVAIFGQEIKRWIFGEKCSISLVDGGFVEKLGDTADSAHPEAQHYDCSITLANSGSREIIGCQLFICEVHYRPESGGKFKSVQKLADKALYWRLQEIKSRDLLPGESREFPLFIIYPENSHQTPDNQFSFPLSMRISGARLDDKYTKKGAWIVKYQVRSKERILKSFEIMVQWDGTWHSRITEMEEVVSVNLKEE